MGERDSWVEGQTGSVSALLFSLLRMTSHFWWAIVSLNPKVGFKFRFAIDFRRKRRPSAVVVVDGKVLDANGYFNWGFPFYFSSWRMASPCVPSDRNGGAGGISLYKVSCGRRSHNKWITLCLHWATLVKKASLNLSVIIIFYGGTKELG